MEKKIELPCGHRIDESTVLKMAGKISWKRRKNTVAGPGRKKQPTLCLKCGVECPGAREARAHCRAAA